MQAEPLQWKADITEQADMTKATAEKEKPGAWDWLPAKPWTCPRCQRTITTREAAPRCACGFVEGS